MVYIKYQSGIYSKQINPGQEPVADFCLCDGEYVEEVYAYCNLHGFGNAKTLDIHAKITQTISDTTVIYAVYLYIYEENKLMKYVCDVCGWEYDEEEGYLKVVLHQEQSGRMFRKILNAH